MYILKKRPIKKPGLKKPNKNSYKKNKKSRLNHLPDEIIRNVYQFIFPLSDIYSDLSLWCYCCGEYIPQYETCIEEYNNCYNYIQINSYEKNRNSKLYCLQCFIAEIYP